MKIQKPNIYWAGPTHTRYIIKTHIILLAFRKSNANKKKPYFFYVKECL